MQTGDHAVIIAKRLRSDWMSLSSSEDVSEPLEIPAVVVDIDATTFTLSYKDEVSGQMVMRTYPLRPLPEHTRILLATPIQWSEMTPGERNRVIATKIMGITDFHCDGKFSLVRNREMLSRRSVYICSKCQMVLKTTNRGLERHGLPEPHMILVPRYTESMDAAWEVVKRVSTAPYDWKFLSWIATNYDVCSKHADEATSRLSDLAALTPEKICLAALRACGVEVKP